MTACQTHNLLFRKSHSSLECNAAANLSKDVPYMYTINNAPPVHGSFLTVTPTSCLETPSSFL